MACKREILQERMLGNGPRKDENVVQTQNLLTRAPEIKENKAVPDIIIIDDDDDDDSGEGENCNTSEDVEFCEGDDESDAGSRSHRLYHHTQPRCDGAHNRCGSRDLTKPGPSQLSWCLHRTRKGEKRPVQIAFDNNIGESSTSSDCEIIEDVGGKFRREWEEASLRKQLGKAQSCQAESEESTTVTNTTSSLARRRLQREGKFQYQETSPSVQGRSDPCQSGSSIPSFQKGSDEDENRFTMPKLAVFYDQQDSNDFDAKSVSCSDSADDLSKDISSSFGNEKDAFNEGTSSPHLKSLTVESNNDNMSGGKDNYVRGVGNNELRNQRFEAQGSSALRSIAKAGEALQHTKREDWALWQDGQCQRKKCKVDTKEKNITKGKSKRK